MGSGLDARTRMAHLLRRAGFGAAPGEVEERLNAGFEATVHTLVESAAVSDGLADVNGLIGGILDFNNIEDVRTWWIYRMVHSQRPLVEKMAFFWHGHFASSVGKVGSPFLMFQQNQLFREFGLGSFGALLQRVARDPAMLIYLDGASNKKGHPNENFAREVMELFTTGFGHYDERDVLEGARAFTGWGLKEGKAFAFNVGDHDFGQKTFMGKTGAWDGADILDRLTEHAATAERLTRKLFSFFVFEEPDARTLAPFIDVWKQTRGNIREVVRALFLSPVFSSPRAYRAKIKSPAEFVIGAMRSLGGAAAPRAMVALMARMGQDLFNPPSVKGWDGGAAWMSTSTLFERFNFAASITTQRGPEGTSHVDPEKIFNGLTPTTAQQMLELAIAHLLDGQLAGPQREAMLSYLKTPDPDTLKGKKDAQVPPFALDARTWDEKARGMLHLLLSTPEYQLC